jgi:hypothetical protein
MRLFELALALDWTPVATAIVGALAVLGGQGLAGRQQARNQERLERYQERLEGQRRRERAAQVLADVTALLVDAEAIRISGTILKAQAGRETLLGSQGTLVNRHGQLRGQLLALSTGHPSPEVRALARQLESALGQYLHSIWMTFALPQQAGLRRPVSERGREHAEVERLLQELVEAVEQA